MISMMRAEQWDDRDTESSVQCDPRVFVKWVDEKGGAMKEGIKAERRGGEERK